MQKFRNLNKKFNNSIQVMELKPMKLSRSLNLNTDSGLDQILELLWLKLWNADDYFSEISFGLSS